VLSGRGLCDEQITRPEQSYRLWCVVVCDLENLKNEEAMTRVGSQRHRKKCENSYRYVTYQVVGSCFYRPHCTVARAELQPSALYWVWTEAFISHDKHFVLLHQYFPKYVFSVNYDFFL